MSRRVTAAEYRSLLVDDEADVQRRILVALADMGIEADRTQSGKRSGGKMNLGKPGRPDVTGYLPNGRYLGIEVKRPGEKIIPGSEQDLWHQRARKAGCAVTCVDNLRDAIAFVQSALREPWPTR